MLPLSRSERKFKVFIVDTIEQELLDEMSKDHRDLQWCITKKDKIYLVFKKWMDG